MCVLAQICIVVLFYQHNYRLTINVKIYVVHTYLNHHLAFTLELNIAGLISVETGLIYSVYLQLTSFTFTTNIFTFFFLPRFFFWIVRGFFVSTCMQT